MAGEGNLHRPLVGEEGWKYGIERSKECLRVADLEGESGGLEHFLAVR
jgi:hypothetical protein